MSEGMNFYLSKFFWLSVNLQLLLQVETCLVKSGSRKCFAVDKGGRVLPTVACLVRRPEEIRLGNKTGKEENVFTQVERDANHAPLYCSYEDHKVKCCS